MNNAFGVPQRIVVVGATSEIAIATVRSWIDLGVQEFFLIARDKKRLEAVAKEVTSAGAIAETAIADAQNIQEFENAIKESLISRDFDVALISLGVLGVQNKIEADPKSAKEVIDVNFTATGLAALYFANRIEEQRHGTIVLLSSVASLRGRRDNFVYGATKAAIDLFGEGLEQRVKTSGGEVCIIRPGFVRTSMTDGLAEAPFACGPEAVARDIVHAVSKQKSIVFTPKILRLVFWVFLKLPRSIWRLVVRISESKD